MNTLKITLILIGISSFSFSFAQTAEQDYSHMDKNKDGKIDKTEFENAPPPPPAPKKASAEGEVTSSDKSDAAPAAAPGKQAHPRPITFDAIDKNNDGIIDMDEFTENHTAIRKRPGAQVNKKK
jgi:Ca2+-binding EF-hand superfamily protein